MPIINFTIPKILEKRVDSVVKRKGFATKAEFFRFAAMSFIETNEKETISEDERTACLTRAISKEVVRKYKNKKVPAIRKQLIDL
ncbi:ribbon-helix-helix domain-containing protein [Patescibacteria group bacterium]